jgi:hypothetical protein
MIAVGLHEPVGQTVVAASVGPERLAHRADEESSAVPRHVGGSGSCWSRSRCRRCLRCQEEQGSKEHRRSEAPANLAAK